MLISFEELRRIKDRLPDGSMHHIAKNLGLTVETVRNYFGGANFEEGKPAGMHFEKGFHGGYVRIEDTAILDSAMSLLEEAEASE